MKQGRKRRRKMFKNLNNVPLAVILPVPLTVTRPGNIKHAVILAIINLILDGSSFFALN